MSYWVNVDLPTSSYRLHKVICPYCTPRETSWKGIESIKRDGGWYEFETKNEAKKFKITLQKNVKWDPCTECNP